MSLWLLAILFLAVINLLTWWAWGIDKTRAIQGRRRIPEATLLTLCALGGWPAAIAGAHVFRHKTSKMAFIAKFCVVVGLQIAVICFGIVLL